MTASAFLAARNVTHHAPGGDVLLQDVSFDLQKGAILAIAGPNGAGKTTLLNLLCGACEMTTGDTRVGGQSLARMSASTRARTIAVVGQHEHPDHRLALRDYIALGQIPVQADRAAPEHATALQEVLELTGLQDLADKPMGVLSGGERQRAHLARALAQTPSLLFLDEPTNHLDPDAKGRMLSLVCALGITVVMILHDIALIPEFATHAALLKGGRLTAFGPVADVLTPEQVRATFGVDYLRFQHEGRIIPALDIRNTHTASHSRNFST